MDEAEVPVPCLDVYYSTGSWLGIWDCTRPAGHDGPHAHNEAVFWPRAD